MALRELRTPEEWAQNHLERAGYACTKVHRVYKPAEGEPDVIEACYLADDCTPKTAYLTSAGQVRGTRDDW